jgi:hypothetical protein
MFKRLMMIAVALSFPIAVGAPVPPPNPHGAQGLSV